MLVTAGIRMYTDSEGTVQDILFPAWTVHQYKVQSTADAVESCVLTSTSNLDGLTKMQIIQNKNVKTVYTEAQL